jgi:hypothetical protein
MSDYELALDPILVKGEIVYVNKGGEIWKWVTHANQYSDEGFQKLVNKPTSEGYICPQINGTCVKQHRLIAAAFLGLDLANTKCQVDHINRIRHDNRLVNLRLVTCQQNHFNTNAKGYYWNKQKNKWHAQIYINGKKKYLGYYDIEEDARSAYLAEKAILHLI